MDKPLDTATAYGRLLAAVRLAGDVGSHTPHMSVPPSSCEDISSISSVRAPVATRQHPQQSHSRLPWRVTPISSHIFASSPKSWWYKCEYLNLHVFLRTPGRFRWPTDFLSPLFTCIIVMICSLSFFIYWFDISPSVSHSQHCLTFIRRFVPRGGLDN